LQRRSRRIVSFSVPTHPKALPGQLTFTPERTTTVQVLIFCTMTKALDLIEEHLEWRGWSFVRMDGSTATEGRGAIVDAFNAPDSPHFVFLLSTRTGGVGLNLQTADTAILYDSDWNPQVDSSGCFALCSTSQACVRCDVGPFTQ
jgi:SNF2 family DNA or RNA helicase